MSLARALLAFVLLALGLAADQAAAQRPYRIYAITFRGMTDVERGFQDYFAARRIPVQITWRDLVVDPAGRFVQRAGTAVELTEQEFAVLLALLEDRPRTLSRADIQARSGNRVGDGSSVEVHVHHLRRKLGESVIQTVRGVGYRIPPPAAAA